MKKVVFMLLCVMLIPCLALFGQDKDAQKPEELLKNLSVVKKTEPVPEKMKTGFDSIQAKDAGAYLKFISSDLLEGRDTGSRGYDIAAEYAASMFTYWGLKPAGDMVKPKMNPRDMLKPGKKMKKPYQSYFQEVPLKQNTEAESAVVVNLRKGTESKSMNFHQNVDYGYRPDYSHSISAPLVFVGYGINEKSAKFDEYKGLDVKGKIVVILKGVPDQNLNSPFKDAKLKSKYVPPRSPAMRMRMSPKIKIAEKKGAAAILMVESSTKTAKSFAKARLDRKKINDEEAIIPHKEKSFHLIEVRETYGFLPAIPVITVSREMADNILNLYGQRLGKLQDSINKGLKPHSMELKGMTFTLEAKVKSKLVPSRNVLGYIEGSDPQLKDEVVIIGAHLDHLGKWKDYIYNGADDNGSGSAAVMEIAEAFAKNPVKPKRSVMFALWTAEEKGLLGSRFYVTHPVFPRGKTAAYINLDMVSRKWTAQRLKMMGRLMFKKVDIDKVLEKIDLDKFITPGFHKSNTAIADAIRQSNRWVGMSLLLMPNDKKLAGRSDHAPFAFMGIPWASFVAGFAEDFHRPSDSFDKVDLELMRDIARIIYLSAYQTADK